MYATIEDVPKDMLIKLQAVLRKVNTIRTALAYGEGKLKELPPGITGDEQHCVLAKALSNGWRAEVNEGVTLRHEAPETIDWDAGLAKLRMEFQADVRTDSEWNPATQAYDREVKEFIIEDGDFEWFVGKYDNGYFEWLILND